MSVKNVLMKQAKPYSLNYTPYKWQARFHHEIGECRFACLISGRQQGKTELAVAELCDRALAKRANYGYLAPTSKQGRTIFWPRLKKIIANLAHECDFRETDLQCRFPNGSVIYCLTGENETARGLSLAGLLVDEYDSIKTSVWQNAILPTLSSFPDHFIIFIGTLSSSGKLWGLYEKNKNDPAWYCSIVNAVASGCFTQEQLDGFLARMGEAAFAREYMCDPNPPVSNSVIGQQIFKAEKEGRIRDIPINPVAEVHTAWDLGFRDATAIWVFQLVGSFIHIIGYHEYSNISLVDICHRLRVKYNNFGIAVLPHDAANTDLTSGVTRKDTIEEILRCYSEVLQKINPAEGLGFVRLNVERCIFHQEKTQKGLQRLKAARYVMDSKTDTITDRVLHDANSHPLDAFRYLCTYIEIEYPTNETHHGGSFRRRIFTPQVTRCIK